MSSATGAPGAASRKYSASAASVAAMTIGTARTLASAAITALAIAYSAANSAVSRRGALSIIALK